MKKTSLLMSLALGTAISVFAAEPVKVAFTPVANPTGDPEQPFPVYLAYGQELWGDYNNDGKLDRFLVGGNGNQHFYLYKNEGSFFSRVDAGITPLGNAAAVLLDADNDGNLDILIAGKDGENNNHNELWLNQGAAGEYAFVKDETFPNFGICDHEGQSRCNFMIAFDYDNDGWSDIMLTGFVGDGEGGEWVAKLYKNSYGYFQEVEMPVNGEAAFRPIVKGSVQAADINGDGYVDILLSGEDANEEYRTLTTIYYNNGDGTFREIEDPGIFQGQNRGTTFAIDIDNDGLMDIVEMGDNEDYGHDIGDGRKRVANIYHNQGDESFFMQIPAASSGLLEMRAMPSVGDVNNDGYSDILVTGGWEDDFTHLFYNNGDETFTSEFFPRELNGRDGVASLVDFDGDGALDVSIEGWCDDWHNVLLLNEWADGLARPQAPTAPTNFVVTQDGDDVVLSWNKSTDDTTPSDALRYNIYVQAKTAEDDGFLFTYAYAPVDIETGFLRSTGKPHLISGTTITMKGFNIDDYNFGVQAVDNGWLSSAFTRSSIASSINNAAFSSIIVRAENKQIALENADECTYSVYDLNGRTLAKDINASSSVGVEKGIYIVKIAGTNLNEVRKVIVR